MTKKGYSQGITELGNFLFEEISNLVLRAQNKQLPKAEHSIGLVCNALNDRIEVLIKLNSLNKPDLIILKEILSINLCRKIDIIEFMAKFTEDGGLNFLSCIPAPEDILNKLEQSELFIRDLEDTRWKGTLYFLNTSYQGINEVIQNFLQETSIK